MLKNYIKLIIAIVFASNLMAQSAWTIYNKSNKTIISDTVYQTIIDLKGNKWFATANGISKFDGNSWLNYQKDIPSSKFYMNFTGSKFNMKTDKVGNFWFSLPYDGLTKFDGTNWFNFKTSNSGILYNNIRHIHNDLNNVIWIGTYNGVSKFDGINWSNYTTTNCGINSNNIYYILSDLKDNIWCATDKGLSKFDGVNWSNYNFSNSCGFIDQDGFITGFFKQILPDTFGNLWVITESIGGNTGLSKFDGSNWSNYRTINSGISCDTINHIKIDVKGIIWLATNKGISKFNGINWSSFDTSNSGIKSNFVNHITFDSLENMWISTDKGISKFDGINWINYDSKNTNINIDYIDQIEIDPIGDKWINTKFGVVKLSGNGNSQICILNSPSYNYSFKKVIQCYDSHYIVKINNWDQSIKKSTLSWFVLEKDKETFVPKLLTTKTDSLKVKGGKAIYASLSDSICKYDYFVPQFKYISLQEIKKDTTLNTNAICLVTNQNNHNLVVWENIDNDYVSRYRIYKQNQTTSNYELVHEQSKHENSEWLDTLSKTNTNIDRYKISIFDSCGNETPLSNNHTTMLLSSNVGLNGTVNLTWNGYEGFDYQNFEIWRSTDGVNFNKISTVANNSYAYIDNNPPATAWYQIRISKQDACNPTKRVLTSVNSNIISKEGKSLGLKNMENNAISIYPNPSNGSFTLKSTSTMIGKPLNIIDITGRSVYASVINATTQNVSMENIENGTYFLSIDNKEAIKLIKE